MNKYISSHNLWFWLAFLAGFFVITLPYIGFNFEWLPGDLGDTRFNLFILEHGKQFLSGEVASFWSANFMYPEPEIISLSDNLLGAMPIYAFFRWIGFGLFSAFQLWVVVLTLLNYWASYKLSSFLIKDYKIAVITAFIFTFSLSLTSQMNHVQMLPRFAFPFALLFLFKWFENFNSRDFGLALLLFVYQFYCGIYLGFMSFLPFIIVLGIGVYHYRKNILLRLKKVRELLRYVSLTAINFVFLILLFLPYLRRAKDGQLNTYEQIYESIPTGLSYLSVSPSSWLYGSTNEIVTNYTAFWDHWISPGFLTILSFIIIIVLLIVHYGLNKKTLIKKLPINLKWTLIAGVVTFIVFLRIDNYSLYYFLQKLPGFGAMRSITRIVNVELLFFGLATGVLLVKLLSRWIKYPFLIMSLSIGFLLVENYCIPSKVLRVSKTEMQNRHNQLREKMKHLEEGTIISYEPEELEKSIETYQIDAMLAAQSLHLKSINGYSGTAPIDFHHYWTNPNKKSLEIWLKRFPEVDIKDVERIY